MACQDIEQALMYRDQIPDNELSDEDAEEICSGVHPSYVKLLGKKLVVDTTVIFVEIRKLVGLDDKKSMILGVRAYRIRAECFAAQMKFEAAIGAYKQTLFTISGIDDEMAWLDLFLALLQQYNGAQDYKGLIQRVKDLAPEHRSLYLWRSFFVEKRPDDLICRAAKISGLKEDLFDMFIEGRDYHVGHPVQQAMYSYRMAEARWRVFDEEDLAYRELDMEHRRFYGPDGLALKGPFAVDGDNFWTYVLALVNQLLSEIIFSRIHSSQVKWVKNLLIHDLERVTTGVSSKQKNSGSQIALVIAQGSALIGRAHLDHGRDEGLKLLNPIFEQCITALTDDVDTNDTISFLLLARVLVFASVKEPSLKRDAEIAYSLRSSIVDPRFKKIQSLALAADEDIDPEKEIYCDGVCKIASAKPETPRKLGWQQNFYMCLICSELDLCQECYDKRIAANEASQERTEWRNYCGFKHDYIKGPIEGWGGVKDGIISLGGEQIKFEHWLKDLQAKWKDMEMKISMHRRKTEKF